MIGKRGNSSKSLYSCRILTKAFNILYFVMFRAIAVFRGWSFEPAATALLCGASQGHHRPGRRGVQPPQGGSSADSDPN
jgi:hypothetical protein